MNRSWLRLLVAFASVLSAVGTAALADAAETIKYDSNVSINKDGLAFSGLVKSENDGCKAERRVLLKARRPGDDAVIGTDETGKDGRWSINAEEAPGEIKIEFYARLKQLRTGAAGSTYVCKADTSQSITVTP